MARTFKTGLGVYGDRVIVDADFSTAGYVKQSGNVGAHPSPYQATVETFDQALVSGVTSVTIDGHPGAQFASGHASQPTLVSANAFKNTNVYTITVTVRFKLDSLSDASLLSSWSTGLENFILSVSAAGAITCGVKEAAGGGYVKTSAAGVITTGVTYCVSFTINPAIQLLLSVNGATVAITNNTWVSSTATGNYTTSLRTTIPCSPTVGDSLVGFVDIARLQGILMTQAELNALTLDPHQVYVDAEGGGPDATAPGATLTGTSSISAGSASGGSGGTDATAPGATLTGTSSISAGSASGSGGVGTFTSDAMENNTGAGLLASTAVTWTWWQGAIGATPTSLTHGTGTTSAGGILSLTGLPTGAGFLLVRTADSAGVYYQPGTVA